jgi:hypothetical protein
MNATVVLEQLPPVQSWRPERTPVAQNLTAPVTASWPLVGRAEELELFDRLLADPETTGLGISGAAGVGKTHLR